MLNIKMFQLIRIEYFLGELFILVRFSPATIYASQGKNIFFIMILTI